MADTTDKSHRHVDLTKLDSASKEDLLQVGRIVGVKAEDVNPMTVKSALLKGYSAGMQAETKTHVPSELLEFMKAETATDKALPSLKYNELIDFMKEKKILTPEKAEEYKAPATKDRLNATGNNAALYDYAIDRGLIDTKKLQGYMDQGLEYAIKNIEKKPKTEMTPQLEETVRKLKQDLGVQFQDVGSKNLPEDKRTEAQKAEAAKGVKQP